MRRRPAVLALQLVPAYVLCGALARAETLQAPVGGRAVPFSTTTEARVACGAPSGGWALDVDGRSVKPPAADDEIGKVADLKVAATAAACATPATTETIALVAIGKWPVIDPTATLLAVDDARAELHGKGLRGVVVHWQAGELSGDDRCISPLPEGGGEKCVVAVGRGLSADPTAAQLSFRPAGALLGSDVVTFDATGRRIAPAEWSLRPARIVVNSLIAAEASVDLAGGGASRISLTHPEAVTYADCGTANCDVSGGALIVHGVSGATGALSIALRLLPRVYLRRGEALDPSPIVSVPVLPCAMTAASGEALRGVDNSVVVVAFDARCANEAKSLRYFAGGRSAEVVAFQPSGGAMFVALRVGRVEQEELTITASRSSSDLAVVGAAHVRTRPPPSPRATLEFDGRGSIEFIPTNRPAAVRFSHPDGARLVLLPVEGVYEAKVSAAGTTIQGDDTASGFVALRFGYRVESLPGSLATMNLAVLVDPVERPIHEANVPAPLGASSLGKKPIVELLCGDVAKVGATQVVLPGSVAKIPYAERDTCRLVFHSERIAPEDGSQRLNLDIDVTRVDGTPRLDAHVSQTLILRAGRADRYAWIKGVTGAFDRITVRLAHDADDPRYVGGEELKTGAPAVQWSVISGTSKARIYATTAIPTGLYRVSDSNHSGILSLNFGVIARLTWLDEDGHEGVLGLEAGMMGIGLANDMSSTGKPLTQVATVSGIGLSVPIANRSLATETSINLHAWFEYEVSRDIGNQPGSPLGFVFGPSISIGNIGANL